MKLYREALWDTSDKRAEKGKKLGVVPHPKTIPKHLLKNQTIYLHLMILQR